MIGTDSQAAALDRQADRLLSEGRHRLAKELAHRAATFRSLSVLRPRAAMRAIADQGSTADPGQGSE